MSDHAWILENLAAYLTGGLEPAERERLEQHTADCTSCAAALEHVRTLDAVLAGLFDEARPSAALEDRMIQTLRNRPRDAWSLPVPAWFAIAAAALVLIGITGAVASQILAQGNSTFLLRSPGPNGSMGTDLYAYQAETRQDVTALAAQTRERMLSHLNGEEEGERTSQLWGDDGQKPSDAVAMTGDIKNHTWNLPGRPQIRSDTSKSEGKTYDAPAPPGAVPSTGKPMSNGMAGVPAPAQQLSIPLATATPPPVPTEPAPVPAGGSMALGYGTNQPNYWFEPSKQLGRALTEGKDLKSQSFGRSQPSDGKRAEGGRGEKPSGRPDERLTESLQKEAQGKEKGVPHAPDNKPPEPSSSRKIIRTGEIEYEIQSFDAAVATIARLMKNIKGGFIATVNSDKLANGKVRGSVVVRVPPESLDELILDLRTNLGKSGELKNQRIGSQDITKQYTDLESELKAARAMEERLLQIIKSGKGEIKDLLAAEKELGTWRTRIEKIEGELRYYASQVALSTLTITLYEKEITSPFAIIEREQVQMGIEVEEVDQALQAAQKAVREAKGRITRSELKQPSQGQFSALLDFEVAPDQAGPLRDRLKQLGTVARFDISRHEESEGGAGKPTDGKTKRSDTRFNVHFYNLTDVPPRETVFLSLACVDVETAMRTLLARVEKAAGRVLSSNLNTTRGAQTQGDLQFQVKTPLADTVLEDIKSAGEVMGLQVRETTNVETTRKKRGFQVKLWALEAAIARETDEVQLACADVATSYRLVQEAVLKAKALVRISQLNEQDRRQVMATLDFDVRRADEDGVRAALLKAGAVYTRKVSRAADAENVVDTKVRWQVTFLNQATIPPRETYVFGVEVADVDQTAAMLSALAGKREGRTVEANISRERTGRVTGKLIYDVPMAEVRELLDALKSSGTVRVQQTVKHPEVPDSSLAIARLDVTLSNAELIVPSDDGFGPNVRRGLSDSFAVLSWSLRILILGLCVLLPWALVIWGIYRLVVRLRRRTTSTAPAA